MSRIIDLADILTALADADVFAVSDIDANQDKKLTASNLKAYILGGKTIGGSAASDITVNNATQTLTNKTITTPKVNSSTTTAVTSEDLNKLHSVTVSATELNYLSGAVGNLQLQLANKADAISLANRPYFYRATVTTTGEDYTVAESTIRNALGISSVRRISARLMPFLIDVKTAPYYPVQNLSDFVIYPAGNGILDNITFKNIKGGWSYVIIILCYDVPAGGEM